ncbi:MAG: LysR family transcriptional regulator [Candidatus Caldarchaeum sp.]
MVQINLDGRELDLEQRWLELLDTIRRTGSISRACLHLGVSYRTGLNWLREVEERSRAKLVQSVKGGRGGGRTELTEAGRRLLEQYYSSESLHRPGFVRSFIELRLSARNILTGYVKDVAESDLISMVGVELDSRQEVKTVITTDSLKRLAIKPGDRIHVIIKATEALLMKP